MDIIKWTSFEVCITPKQLIQLANFLDKKMKEACIGQDCPRVKIEDWKSKQSIVFIADQDAWHTKDKGNWI